MAAKKKARKTGQSDRKKRSRTAEGPWVVQRVQTGVRIEKRLLKVLKALAEYLDITLGDLLESVVLHAFDGKSAFSKDIRKVIAGIKQIYGLDLDARAGHRMTERPPG